LILTQIRVMLSCSSSALLNVSSSFSIRWIDCYAVFVGNRSVSIYGDWEFIHSSEVETIEEAGYGFSDGDEPNNLEINSSADFVGISQKRTVIWLKCYLP